MRKYHVNGEGLGVKYHNYVDNGEGLGANIIILIPAFHMSCMDKQAYPKLITLL